MLSELWRRKPLQLDTDTSLNRTLDALDLVLMGIGAIIGAGVFVLTGIAAALYAGPGVVFSFILAGTAAMFTALSYAELSSSVGGTGSAYSYAYSGIGEFAAWFIGWNLLLEYAMAISTVAIGWSGYVINFFQALHIHLPYVLTKNPFEGGIINLLAMLIIFLLGLLLCFNVKTSAKFNAYIVGIKLVTILLFIGVSIFYIDPKNWTPFLPFGWSGVMSGAALVFFAYIGFDALSTTVEETINPRRDIPIGIIVSLIVCTTVYIIVSALLTGIANYTTLNVRSPVAEALIRVGRHGFGGIVATGAIAGLTTVILVMYYGLTRICLAIARDGLLPRSFAKINPNTRTPVPIIIILGLIMGIIAGIAPIDKAAELVNIGTLAAFTFVCAGVIVFRITHPDLERPFKLPFYPVIPVLGIIFCLFLMFQLPAITWFRFLIWTIVGILIYFTYGIRHSALRKKKTID